MVTAQNIQDIRFATSMSGYKKTEVDAFLDQCATTIENLTTTNEENARKMQVLAETIVDYRNQEDSIRTALVSAQRMSETILAEANGKATALVADAEEKAAAVIAEAEEKAANIGEESKKNIQAELDELARIQKEVAAFRSRLLATYREHLTLIGILNVEDKTAAPVANAPAEEAAESVEASAPAEAIEVEPAVEVDEPVTVPLDDVKIDISAFELEDEE